MRRRAGLWEAKAQDAGLSFMPTTSSKKPPWLCSNASQGSHPPDSHSLPTLLFLYPPPRLPGGMNEWIMSP